MSFGEFGLINIEKTHGWFIFRAIWFSPLLCDLWRIFKIKNINHTIEIHKDWDWWFHWWTPVWHEGIGPYIIIGLGCIRIMRGY